GVRRLQVEVAKDALRETGDVFQEHRLALAVRAHDGSVEREGQLDDGIEAGKGAVAGPHLLDHDAAVPGAEDVDHAAGEDRLREPVGRAAYLGLLRGHPVHEASTSLQIIGGRARGRPRGLHGSPGGPDRPGIPAMLAGPSGSRQMWPRWPARPMWPSTRRPSLMIAPPTPVPSVSSTASRAPAAAPFQASPMRAAWASFRTRTGMPASRASSHTSPSSPASFPGGMEATERPSRAARPGAATPIHEGRSPWRDSRSSRIDRATATNAPVSPPRVWPSTRSRPTPFSDTLRSLTCLPPTSTPIA